MPGEAGIGVWATGFGCRGWTGSRDGRGSPEKVYLAGKPPLVGGLQVWAVLEGFKAALALS